MEVKSKLNRDSIYNDYVGFRNSIDKTTGFSLIIATMTKRKSRMKHSQKRRGVQEM